MEFIKDSEDPEWMIQLDKDLHHLLEQYIGYPMTKGQGVIQVAIQNLFCKYRDMEYLPPDLIDNFKISMTIQDKIQILPGSALLRFFAQERKQHRTKQLQRIFIK